MRDPVDQLEERLGLPLLDRRNALTALTHKSWVNEHQDEGVPDNERLEFLGDAVIDLAVSHRLMERFPDATEGALSRLRASIVDESGLAEVARALDLGRLLRLGRGEERTGGRNKSSLLADALEAVIASVYLDGGLPRVLTMVDRLFGPALDRAGTPPSNRDFKTQLQELSHVILGGLPRYRVVEERGPDHAKTFVIELSIGERAVSRAEGRTKKEAEQLAARAALEELRPAQD